MLFCPFTKLQDKHILTMAMSPFREDGKILGELLGVFIIGTNVGGKKQKYHIYMNIFIYTLMSRENVERLKNIPSKKWKSSFTSLLFFRKLL